MPFKNNDDDDNDEMAVSQQVSDDFAFIADILLVVGGGLGTLFLILRFVLFGLAVYKYRHQQQEEGFRAALKAALGAMFCLAVSQQVVRGPGAQGPGAQGPGASVG